MSCCISSSASADVKKIEELVLRSFNRIDIDDEFNLIDSRIRFFEKPFSKREEETARFTADEKCYKKHGLTDRELLEAQCYKYGIRSTFHIIGYGNTGAIAMRLLEKTKKLQIFKIRCMSVEGCMRFMDFGEGIELNTTLIPYQGEIVCTGIEGDYRMLKNTVSDSLSMRSAWEAAIRSGTILKTIIPKSVADSQALLRKDLGNGYFKKQQYDDAAVQYEAGIIINSQNTDLYSNLGFCHLKMNRLDDCIAACDAGLVIDPQHIKCSFRKSKALTQIGMLESALRTLQRCDASDRVISDEINSLKVLMKSTTITSPQNTWIRLSRIKGAVSLIIDFLESSSVIVLNKCSKSVQKMIRETCTEIHLCSVPAKLQCYTFNELTTLTLTDCLCVDDVGVDRILWACKKLQHLDVSGTLVTDKCVSILTQHCKVSNKGLTSLSGLPSLPGQQHAPNAQSGRVRRARHRDMLFTSPSDNTISLKYVSLARCDNISPSDKLASLKKALNVDSTCFPSDFFFSPTLNNSVFIFAPSLNWETTRALDVSGRFFHHNKSLIPFLQTVSIGSFALKLGDGISFEEAYKSLIDLGVRENNSLTRLVADDPAVP